MPNAVAALPNVGGALCSTPQSLADAHYSSGPCSNAAKTRNPVKVAGVPQTNEPISVASGLKFTILWGHVGRYCCLTSFYSAPQRYQQINIATVCNCCMDFGKDAKKLLQSTVPECRAFLVTERKRGGFKVPLDIW